MSLAAAGVFADGRRLGSPALGVASLGARDTDRKAGDIGVFLRPQADLGPYYVSSRSFHPRMTGALYPRVTTSSPCRRLLSPRDRVQRDAESAPSNGTCGSQAATRLCDWPESCLNCCGRRVKVQ